MNKIITSLVLFASTLTFAQSNNFCAEFPNSNSLSYANISDDSFSNYDQVTFATWVKSELQVYTYPRLISRNSTAGGGQSRWNVSLNQTTGLVHFGMQDEINNQAGSLVSNTPIMVGIGSWTHVAVVLSAGNVKIYINGVEDANGTIPWGSLNSTSGLPIRIGAEAAAYNHFSGKLDELALWTRALSAQEVSDLMTCQPDMNDIDLQFYYNMEAFSNLGTFVDQSSKNNDAIIGDYIAKIPDAMAYGTCCVVDANISVNGTTISADNTTADSYQWYNCDNVPVLIPGETNSSFTPTVNGSYSVEVTEGSCAETSNCESILTIGLNELSNSTMILYPNPASASISIDSDAIIEEVNIFSMMGDLLVKSNESIISISDLSPGVYYANVKTISGTQQIKFIKK